MSFPFSTPRHLKHGHRRHLPDITIITPVFSQSSSSEIIFFTASRGHHADIGGILPGSMPPTSVNIFEEGAEIESFKIVSGGLFDREGLVERMVERPARYKGSSGCRNFKDVESDLKAVGVIGRVVSEVLMDFIANRCKS
jgi:5-oxoprolinase (ATP-hydrolysing)